MKYRFFYSFIITIALCGFVLYQNALALNLDTTAVSPGLDGNSNYIFNIAGLSIGTTTKTANTLRVGTGGIIFSDGSTQTAGFLGSSQTVSAGNVSQGVFGYPSASSAFAFPAALGIGINTYAGLPANGLYVAGSVGIGTTGPTEKLDVSGAITFNGTTAGYGTATSRGMLDYSSDTVRLLGFGPNTSTYPAFQIYQAGANNTSGRVPLQILSNGNVGIGTTNPGVALEVIRSGLDTSNLASVRSFVSSVSAVYGPSFTMDASTVTNGKSFTINSALSGDAAGIGKLSIRDNSAGLVRMVIDTSGNVGIGTASPGTRFDVVGAGITSVTAAMNIMNASSTSALYVRNDGNVGIGTTSPGEKLEVSGNVKAVSFLYSSDFNLKKDISIIPNALSKVLQLQGVSFKWKTNSEPSIGFIAQDVEKIFPDLVRTDPVTKLKSVQYGNLVAPLVEAVKAQQVQIETYKKNQEDQQKQIDELTEKIKLQVR